MDTGLRIWLATKKKQQIHLAKTGEKKHKQKQWQNSTANTPWHSCKTVNNHFKSMWLLAWLLREKSKPHSEMWINGIDLIWVIISNRSTEQSEWYKTWLHGLVNRLKSHDVWKTAHALAYKHLPNLEILQVICEQKQNQLWIQYTAHKMNRTYCQQK